MRKVVTTIHIEEEKPKSRKGQKSGVRAVGDEGDLEEAEQKPLKEETEEKE